MSPPPPPTRMPSARSPRQTYEQGELVQTGQGALTYNSQRGGPNVWGGTYWSNKKGEVGFTWMNFGPQGLAFAPVHLTKFLKAFMRYEEVNVVLFFIPRVALDGISMPQQQWIEEMTAFFGRSLQLLSDEMKDAYVLTEPLLDEIANDATLRASMLHTVDYDPVNAAAIIAAAGGNVSSRTPAQLIAATRRRARVAAARQNQIPKPKNSWILYRASQHFAVKAQYPGWPVSELSKVIAANWANESAEVKAHFRALAEEEKRQHAILYPSYRCQPRKPSEIKKRKSKKSAAVVVDLEDSSTELFINNYHADSMTMGYDAAGINTCPSYAAPDLVIPDSMFNFSAADPSIGLNNHMADHDFTNNFTNYNTVNANIESENLKFAPASNYNMFNGNEQMSNPMDLNEFVGLDLDVFNFPGNDDLINDLFGGHIGEQADFYCS